MQAILIFCESNRNYIHQLKEEMRKVSVSFLEDNRQLAHRKAHNEQLRQEKDLPIFLVLSDNFLRDVDCMHEVIGLLQDSGLKSRLKSIIVPGRYESGEVPTKFERVSNVIQYMNHWQDQYLELRRRKNKVTPDDEAAYNEQFKIIRSISTEVGEFLRILRGTEFIHQEDLEKGDYQWLFKAIKAPHLIEDYLDAKSTSAVLEENEVLDEAIDLSVIPGMDLLRETQNGTDEMKTALEQNNNPIHEGELIDKVVQFKQEQQESQSNTLPVQTVDEAIETVVEEEALLREETEAVQKAIELKAEALVEKYSEDKTEIEAEKPSVEDLITNEPVLTLQEMEQGALEEYILGNPNDLDARFRYALMLMGTDSLGVKSQLGYILNKDEKYLKAYNMLGNIALEEEDFLLAKNYFEQSIQLDNDQPAVLHKLADILHFEFKGAKKYALDMYKASLAIDEDNNEARYQMAVLLHEHRGKRKKAIKQLRKVIKQDEKHPFAFYDLAVIYFENKDFDLASEYYKKAIEINPELQTEQNDEAFLYAAQQAVSKQKQVPPSTEKGAESIAAILQQNGMHIEAPPSTSKPIEATEATVLPAKKLELSVLITGATAGIGKATAIEFARSGHHLIITGRRADRLAALKQDLEDAYGVQVETLCFDVRDYEACKAAFESLPETMKSVDVLINNAGLAKGLGPIHEGQLEHWETMIDTNIKGLLYMTRLVSPYMVKRHKGHIINIGSIAGKEVYPNGNVYCGTKHAVVALTKGMRIDLHAHNIRVSSVNPAHVEETEFALVRFDGDAQKAKIYEDFKPVTSSDVAEVVYFIATRPTHVNILDVVVQGTQQASATIVDRSGR